MAPSAHATEATAPDAPSDVTAAAGDESLTISWSDPAATGGDRAIEYEVLATPHNAQAPPPPAVTVTGDTFTAVIPALANGVTYDVALRAKNEAGSSPSADTVGTPRTVPAAPSVRTVTAGEGYAVVTWQAPADDGGAAIGGYVVRAEPSGRKVAFDAGATSGKVAPLKNGVATTFTVTATNVAGDGPPSRASSPVTPRLVGHFAVARRPARHVVYGTPSSVRASLVTAAGRALSGQKVQLLARPRDATAWRRVASGTTDGRGNVVLRTVLRTSAALRLRHPTGAVAAPDLALRSTTVAKRVKVAAPPRTRVGMPVVVRGRVAPAQPVGSTVRLQRRVAGSWNGIARGRMVTRDRFVVRWDPRQSDSYALRVVRPRGPDHAAGTSEPWRHRVDPENASDIAKDILRNDRITLATVHVSGGGYLGTPEQNIRDVAAGRSARHSCHGGAPCGSSRIDLRLLRAIRDMGKAGTLTVSEIVGGVHAGASAHYSGNGVDITWVHGRHVAYGTNYGMVVDRCRAHGAGQILTPSNDPYGGHHNHVHCAW